MFRIYLILVSSYIILSLSSCQSNSSLIKACFHEYQLAILNHEGRKAVALIDKGTIDYYSRVLDKVKSLDSSQLEKESLVEKLEILKIRHIISRKDIPGMNGMTLLTTLIDRGITNNGGIDKYTLGKIIVKNDSANAEKISNNKKTPFRYLFSKEEGSWKLRMFASSIINDIALRQLALDDGMTARDYILKLLEKISGTKPSRQIWNPIN
jgi:hypothetical protein